MPLGGYRGASDMIIGHTTFSAQSVYVSQPCRQMLFN